MTAMAQSGPSAGRGEVENTTKTKDVCVWRIPDGPKHPAGI